MHIQNSLWAIGCLFRYYEHLGPISKHLRGYPQPRGSGIDRTPYPFPWELEAIVQLLILEGTYFSNQSLLTWNNMARAGTLCRRIFSPPSEPRDLRAGAPLHYLTRMLDTQIPWQESYDINYMMSYRKIYSHQSLSKIFERKIGYNVDSVFRHSFALVSLFIENSIAKNRIKTDEKLKLGGLSP